MKMKITLTIAMATEVITITMLVWFSTLSALFTWFHRALVHKVAAFYAEVRLASQKRDQLSQQQMGGGHGAATCVHSPMNMPSHVNLVQHSLGPFHLVPQALVHKVAAFYAEVRLASQKRDQLSQQQIHFSPGPTAKH
jgi:hypothetical protein